MTTQDKSNLTRIITAIQTAFHESPAKLATPLPTDILTAHYRHPHPWYQDYIIRIDDLTPDSFCPQDGDTSQKYTHTAKIYQHQGAYYLETLRRTTPLPTSDALVDALHALHNQSLGTSLNPDHIWVTQTGIKFSLFYPLDGLDPAKIERYYRENLAKLYKTEFPFKLGGDAS